MPIAIEGEVEHPDVTALKQRVREVATAYAQRHNWCAEVNRALVEAGIVDNTRLNIKVDFHIEGGEPQSTVVPMTHGDLAGKSEEEQHALFAERLSTEVRIGTVNIKVPVLIDDLNVVESRLPSGGVVPRGYVLRFTGVEGRVQHLVSESALAYNRYWTSALCGASGSWAEESPRGEGRMCGRCSERSERL